uniref:Myb/SANT-like DNA-binding domain-containing protein n=1 Tax=Anolis carolinensis TaxID=28377 RepID=A0A803T568_ANOCA
VAILVCFVHFLHKIFFHLPGEVSVTLEDDDDAPANPLLFISRCRPIQLGNTYLCLSPILPDAGNPTTILDSSKNVSFIPSVANEGGKHWTLNEVRALIRVWSDKSIQQQLEGTVRNKRIFEHVAARLQKFGIDRDWKQCRTKYKNLKHEYKSVKDAHYSGNTSKNMKFFRELDAILGHGHVDKTRKSDHNNSSEKPTDWVVRRTEKNAKGTGEEDSVSNTSGDLGFADTRKATDTVDRDNNTNGHAEEQISTPLKEDIKEEITDLVIPEDGDPINDAPEVIEFPQIKQEPIEVVTASLSLQNIFN